MARGGVRAPRITMSDDGALRAPASVSGVNETSSSGRSGSALEHALEASSRAGVREQAAQRALGGGNVLYDPLGVFLAGERAVASVAGSIEDALGHAPHFLR